MELGMRAVVEVALDITAIIIAVTIIPLGFNIGSTVFIIATIMKVHPLGRTIKTELCFDPILRGDTVFKVLFTSVSPLCNLEVVVEAKPVINIIIVVVQRILFVALGRHTDGSVIREFDFWFECELDGVANSLVIIVKIVSLNGDVKV
jgi:hypothetical protein